MSRDDDGGTRAGAAAAEIASHRQEARHDQGSPIDDERGIAAVLTADEPGLRAVLRRDRAVRDVLRWLPADADAERHRTLCAAARVEHRRRRAAAALRAAS